jgi:threonine dehydrogenase-like Zn-dependent dehydrogenase
MAAEIACIHDGSTVAVFGCGPVGQFVIASAKLLNAGRIFAVDTIPSRLEMAKQQGAEIIDFNREDPIEALKGFTGGIGVDRVIDAVGVDATHPHHGPAAKKSRMHASKDKAERKMVAPKTREQNGNWHPGDAPSQALFWAVEAAAKAGTISIIGVYAETSESFPIGAAMEKNLTLKMGNCNHRKYIPMLLDKVRTGVLDPAKVLTNAEPLSDAIEAYKAFDTRQPGWIKVKLEPSSSLRAA